jgi:hypothetical protein
MNYFNKLPRLLLMKNHILVLLCFSMFVDAKYLSNESCSECHEKIYDEFQTSYHAKTYFNDELHRKVADAVNKAKYDCAVCHMPMANNLADLVTGKARPNKTNRTHTDAISCYFCHTIAYVKKSHQHFDNIKAKQAEGFKPTLFGRLKDPDQTDKHSNAKSPIYVKNACKGCHSFKHNDYNTTIFKAMNDKDDSTSCVECHMPQIAGGNEKMNKKARSKHASHKFLGIRDKEFRKKGVEISMDVKKNKLLVMLKNKMTHPLIIQAARAKFLKIVQKREGKIVWQNYQKDPIEDKQGYFAYSFKKNGKNIIIPATATQSSVHNIEAKETKTLSYELGSIQKGDTIIISLYVQMAKNDCATAVHLKDKKLMNPELIKKVILKL